MSKGTVLSIGLLAVAIAASGGYWLRGKLGTTHEATDTPLAVAASEPAKKERKLLYYRNPMGLPDTSPVPKKDPMGMDYIPVYEGEQDDEPAAANQIKISVEKVQKLGVRTEAAQLRALDQVIRAAGRVEPDERRIYAISPKFEGYVERLYVNVTGQPVAKGQPLFEVYSPELVSAQREYAIAAQGVESLKGADGSAQDGMKQLADSSLLRLKNWDISEEQVKALAKSGEARRTLIFRSPVSGIVTEKKALQGMRFMPGEALYQVADLSAVWVVADVFEQDIGQVKPGAKAKVHINAYPDKIFDGTITYVYPTLKAETRTVSVRVEMPNPSQLLKPAMFARIELPVGGKGEVLTVPTSAIIDSGTRRIVLVQAKEGRFEPREVKLGRRSDNFVEVLEGIRNGEPVVVAANFLIDAESNLKAAVGGFGHASHDGSTPKLEAAAAVPAGGHTGHQESRSAVIGHKADGTVDTVDIKAGLVTLNHGPVDSLKWPSMTMEFQVATPALIGGLKSGMAVSFEFVERKPGEWVITSIKPLAAAAPNVTANPHTGH